MSSEFVHDFMQGFNGGFSFNTSGIIPLVLTILGTWKIFEKTGIEEWKALVPFYREYLIFDLAKEKKANFWIYIGSFIAVFISLFVMMAFIIFGLAMNNESLVIIGLLFITIMLASFVVMIVYLVRAYYKLFILFGKEKGISLVLAIFYNIGLLIVGFDSSVYNGDNNSAINENGMNTYVSNEKINFCSNCGSKVNGNFCQNCGNKIE